MSEDLRLRSDSKYEHRADMVVEALALSDETQGPTSIIALGGVSGTGKTSFAQRLGRKVYSASVLHIDNYLSPRSQRLYDIQDYIDLDVNPYTPHIEGLLPNAWDLPQLVDDVQLFSKGETIVVPIYDSIIKEPTDQVELKPSSHLIIEGAHALNISPIQDMIQNRILLSANFHDRLMRKIVRSARINMRESLDTSITRYINGSDLAWQYYMDEYVRRADIVVDNPAEPSIDYAYLDLLPEEQKGEYQLVPTQDSGELRAGENLRIQRNKKTIGQYALTYFVDDRLIVTSKINSSTLDLLLGYYDISETSDE